jgi:copper chaperone CopZ
MATLLGLFGTNAAFSQQPTPAPNPADTQTTIMKVKGITCSADLKTIMANVEKVSGVTSCKPGKQGPTTSFEIRYNPAQTTEKEIQASIEGTGGCKDPNERPYKVKQ